MMLIWTLDYAHLYIAFTTGIQIALLYGANPFIKKEKNIIFFYDGVKSHIKSYLKVFQEKSHVKNKRATAEAHP